MPEKAHIVGNELRRRNPTTILRLYLQKRDTETEKPRQKSAVFSIFSRRTVCALRARGKSHAGLLWIAGFLVVGVVVAFLFTFCFQSKGQLCCCFYQNILASRYKAQVLGWHLPFGVLASSWARCAAGATLFSLTFFVWLRRHWIDIRNQTNTSWSGLDLAHWHAYLVQLALGLLPMTFTAPTRKQRQNFFLPLSKGKKTRDLFLECPLKLTFDLVGRPLKLPRLAVDVLPPCPWGLCLSYTSACSATASVFYEASSKKLVFERLWELVVFWTQAWRPVLPNSSTGAHELVLFFLPTSLPTACSAADSRVQTSGFSTSRRCGLGWTLVAASLWLCGLVSHLGLLLAM